MVVVGVCGVIADVHGCVFGELGDHAVGFAVGHGLAAEMTAEVAAGFTGQGEVEGGLDLEGLEGRAFFGEEVLGDNFRGEGFGRDEGPGDGLLECGLVLWAADEEYELVGERAHARHRNATRLDWEQGWREVRP